MSFLLNPKPNWIMPVFRQQIVEDPFSVKIQFKRFPADYMWRDFIDLTVILSLITAINAQIADMLDTMNNMQVQIDETEAIAIDAYELAVVAQDLANDGIIDAATAYGLAEAASNDAAAALALASAGGGARRATMWMDEAHYTVGTPTTLIGDAYLGNFVRYTTTNLAEFTFSFVSGALNDGGIYLLGAKGATSGIVEVRIDGTLVGTVDLYNATTLNNQLLLIGFGFGNPTFTAGYHKLSVKVNGKHASSSGWAAAFTKIYIRTNAD